MEDIKWQYIKDLKNKNAVREFLKRYGIVIPEKIVDFLTVNNGGRPTDPFIFTESGNEYVFQSLFSYNENDLNSIYKYYPDLFFGTSLYPLGMDSSGNFICYDVDTHQVLIQLHETGVCEKLVY